MHAYKTFYLRCGACLNDGRLTIESSGQEMWDYAILGFFGTVHKEGPELSGLQCARCGKLHASITSEHVEHEETEFATMLKLEEA